MKREKATALTNQKNLSPIVIGNEVARRVFCQFEKTGFKYVSEQDAHWLASWLKKEVREAIKRERK